VQAVTERSHGISTALEDDGSLIVGSSAFRLSVDSDKIERVPHGLQSIRSSEDRATSAKEHRWGERESKIRRKKKKKKKRGKNEKGRTSISSSMFSHCVLLIGTLFGIL
jgi:hypothetical protein